MDDWSSGFAALIPSPVEVTILAVGYVLYGMINKHLISIGSALDSLEREAKEIKASLVKIGSAKEQLQRNQPFDLSNYDT